jgi:hypothetical protein
MAETRGHRPSVSPTGRQVGRAVTRKAARQPREHTVQTGCRCCVDSDGAVAVATVRRGDRGRAGRCVGACECACSAVGGVAEQLHTDT